MKYHGFYVGWALYYCRESVHFIHLEVLRYGDRATRFHIVIVVQVPGCIDISLSNYMHRMKDLPKIDKSSSPSFCLGDYVFLQIL